MENQLFSKKEMLAQGFTLAQVKSLVPVSFVKTGGPGRPAAQYSQGQVDDLKATAVVEAVTVKPIKVKKVKVAAEVVAAVEPVVTETVETDEVTPVVAEEPASEDLTDADFAQVA